MVGNHIIELPWQDRFGNPIMPGALVTWPKRVGSNLSTVEGVVIAISEQPPQYSWEKGPRQRVIIEECVSNAQGILRRADHGTTPKRWTERIERVTVVQSPPEVTVTEIGGGRRRGDQHG